MFPFLGSLPQTTNLVVCVSRGRVNYQMQIVTKLPNGTTEVAQNDSQQPILPNLQLFQSFPTEVVQNDSEQPIQAKLLIPSYSEPLQWEKIGKVVNWAKLAVQSHFEPLWWEKIGKVVNRVKLLIPSHSGPLQREKIGKVVNRQNWLLWVILSHFGGKRLEKSQSGKIDCSESFWATSVVPFGSLVTSCIW